VGNPRVGRFMALWVHASGERAAVWCGTSFGVLSGSQSTKLHGYASMSIVNGKVDSSLFPRGAPSVPPFCTSFS
jgi:hypothetical protein